MRLRLTLVIAIGLSFPMLASVLHQKPISVPFEVVGSYVIVKIKINHSTALNLILDSGVRTTIITELNPADSILLNYSDSTILKGLGKGIQLTALTSSGNTMQIGKLNLDNQTIYVLAEDVFNLSKYTGTRINGLIGSDLFQDYVVEIDYDHQRILFHNPKTFVVPKGFESRYLTIEGQKMYIQIVIKEIDGTSREVKMLVDTGAELAAWFRGYGNTGIKAPEKKIRGLIGQGLNGEIAGYIGKIPEIKLGESTLKLPIVTFPDSASIADVVVESDRDGTIGSQILSRFNIIFDIQNNLFYFKPNSNFKKNFSYNIAGIELMQQNQYIRIPEVLYVWEKSPAETLNVQKGDVITEVNGRKSFEYSINELRKIFETPSRYPLKLLLLRGEESIYVKIEMKSAI
jgi:hypothetical protein